MSDDRKFDTVFRAPRVITAAGEVARCIGVRDGVVTAIEPLDSDITGDRVVELGDDEVLLPGLVDTHVHVNEPGRTDWEGFESATKAAAAGGVTTLIDMPLNSVPPTTTVEALEIKREVAQDKVWMDVGFWGGSVPDNFDDLRGLHDAGVFGFKCFLLFSGVEEFPHLDSEQLERALRQLRSYGAMMIVHAEDENAIDNAPTPGGDVYADFLASRPRGAENLAIAQVIERARWTGARVHILHLSSSDALPMITTARRDGVRLTVETTPHYLCLSSEEIPNGATEYKCCPPIREADNRELLWQGVADGVIDCVVTDHSPSTIDLKHLETGDFGTAWGGVAGLQVSLPAVWSQARRRGYTLCDVVRWMAENPAKQVGLTTKGHISIGYAADFSVFAPDDAFVVDVKKLHHKNQISAYDGRALAGVVRSTWLAGEVIDVDAAPRGRLLSRGRA